MLKGFMKIDVYVCARVFFVYVWICKNLGR